MNDITAAAPQANSVATDLTFSVAEGAARLGATEAWYLKALRAGLVPGRKFGRIWRLTDADINAALQISARPAADRYARSSRSAAVHRKATRT
ncbi:hypothetical protein [Mycobacteroides abscessus]|uniref:hypothetical protein n=1 Tax=Mycobacteroides abscessus TaxID=36809 RepID=UPI00130011F3|nr:hypothetical protein [Mycobacteroides abscessus]